MRSALQGTYLRPSRLTSRFAARVSLFSVIAFLSAAPLIAGDWPQFRGPNCSGIANSTDPLPVKFSATESKTENVAWSAELGDGIGSPVVAAGRVFVSAMIGKERVGLFCYDAATGDKLWKRDWATGTLAEIHKTNSQAATTPAADGERVYFYFSTLGLLALDARDGTDAWKVPMPVPYFVFKWGAGMSPVLHDDMVIFCQDDDLFPAMYGVDKRTGKVRWKTERGDMAVNYSHPVICQTPRGPEIVVAGTGTLIGYSPKNGKPLWTARTLLRNVKTTPVTHKGIVYISLQSGGIANQWLTTADDNKDGKLTKAEMQKFVGEVKIPESFMKKFDRGDVNNDGFLEGEELDKAFLDAENFAGARHDAKDASSQFILAVRSGGSGDVTKTHVLWKHPSRAPDHIVSPLVVENRMFVVKGGGISSCFETSGGTKLWYQKRIKNVCNHFASPVYGDGKIYIAGENGKVVVLESGPKLKFLAKNDLGDSILATPAIADGRLFFRTRKKLICVGGGVN